MKANFGAIQFSPDDVEQEELLNERAEHLAATDWLAMGYFRGESELPPGYEGYYCVDVLGKEFKWMNEHFPKEQYKWYLWFESVFLVPEDMALVLKLRWS